ncbi:MAG: HNH endonuclease [Armatimonadetes bacterium]|nr:HNH endonuclease [Armatimonadota bacterium]
MRVPAALLERIRAVKAKRPRVVLEHILEHGHITTQELRDDYGYNHPPRAARDVRERGIELETFRTTGKDGRSIGAYRLVLGKHADRSALRGRKAFPKSLKKALADRDGSICQVCNTPMASRYLQIDHRIPYDIAGDNPDASIDPKDFMLLCGECNRAKSWSCEHCSNRAEQASPDVCSRCYWAHPKEYDHIAQSPHRRVVVTWQGNEESEEYQRAYDLATQEGISLSELIKGLLRAGSVRD